MTFYLKEEFLSFDHFDIWDEQDQLVYSADREFFTFGKKLNVEGLLFVAAENVRTLKTALYTFSLHSTTPS